MDKRQKIAIAAVVAAGIGIPLYAESRGNNSQTSPNANHVKKREMAPTNLKDLYRANRAMEGDTKTSYGIYDSEDYTVVDAAK